MFWSFFDQKVRGPPPYVIQCLGNKCCLNVDQMLIFEFFIKTYNSPLFIISGDIFCSPIFLVYSTFPVYEQYYMTILYSYLYQSHCIDIHYTNTSNVEKLRGNRSIIIPAEIINGFITLSRITLGTF